MTKTRIREIRAQLKAGGYSFDHAQRIVEECLATVIELQSRTRRGEDPSTSPEELPLAAAVNPAKKARGTQEEFEAYAQELKLPATDGEYFHAKMIATDWKISGRPVKDWRAALRQWKTGGYLPSQKNGNGSAAPSGPARCVL
jgi:hypothetical protein